MTPTPEMTRLAEQIAIREGQITPKAYARAKRVALAAIIETTERAAKLAAWAHMVPPDGGSPTEEESALADRTATAIRNGEHLR